MPKKKVSRKATRTAEKEAAPPEETVRIQPPKMHTFKVKICGTTPLIINQFSNKADIEGNQGKGPKPIKQARDPHAEYLAACYVFPGHTAREKGCKYGVPARMIKRAAVEACRFDAGITMVFARGAFHILEEENGLVELKFKSMNMRTDPVRLKNGSLDLRYRPEFHDWSVVVSIYYNSAAITPETIINLMAIAGVSCGWGELRPNPKEGAGGSNGLFEVTTA